LLIIDDSVVMRMALRRMVEGDPQIEVVDMAVNGRDGVEKVRALRPDVVTLDVEMPVLNGLEALKVIMAEAPTPVIMVSSLTTSGAEATLEALATGAVDFLPKPAGQNPVGLHSLREELLAKIRAAAGARLVAPAQETGPPKPVQCAPAGARSGEKAIVIGTSTGGPRALQTLVPMLPQNLPAGVLIVQHMPGGFTGQLAQRLDRMSEVTVREGEEGMAIEPGHVLIAPGGVHMVARDRQQVGLETHPEDMPHRPAVDVLCSSVAAAFGPDGVGVILTGMGDDGKKGLGEMKSRGAPIVAQDEATCTIYGMPRVVVEAGLADRVCPLQEIPRAILWHLRPRT